MSTYSVNEIARFGCCLHNRSRVSSSSPRSVRLGGNRISCTPINLYRQIKIPRGFGGFDGCRSGFPLKNQRFEVKANCSSSEQQQDSDSNSNSNEESDVQSNESEGASASPSPKRREKHGESGWWKWQWQWQWQWPWQPLVKVQEIGLLLLQVGIMFSVLRMLRPGLSLPGTETAMVVSVPYSDFLSRVNNNKVRKVVVDGVHIMFNLKPEVGNVGSEVRNVGSEVIAVNQQEEFVQVESLLERATGRRILYTTTRPNDIKTPYEKMLENEVEFGSPDKRTGGFFSSAMMSIFYLAVLAGLFYRFQLKFSPMSKTGKLRIRKSGSPAGGQVSEQGETITFADVAGVDEAKEELEDIVDFLRNPDRYTRVGARPPRGVLLVGLPGTGKTLLAKAVAGEADVPFISCSASEFVELYVGMGASRVRDLFARAKREAPSIIFIDEIDAVAKSRDSGHRMGSNDEREQTLNQLLTEMDGFDSNSSVIVLGATNRQDVLDPALRRPGRFDRVVMVETPDRLGREAILKVHVSKKELPLGKDVDLRDIASMTTGFTGADLANLVNEAALLAGRVNKLIVEKIDFIQAVERSIAGIEKKQTKLQGGEKGVVARHEAGHAVVGTAVAKLLSGQPLVQKLSILPRTGGALGFTYSPPTNEDRYLLFIDELRGRLVTLLGGRAAEEFIYDGRVSTGALDDIRRATDMAYKAVAEYGLNDTIGPISITTLSAGGLDGGGAPWGKDQGHLVDLVQGEVKALLQSALEVAVSVMRANPAVLEGLGAYLEEKEKVEGEELQKWLKLVVAPAELSNFVEGKKKEVLLPLQASL